MQDLSPAVRGAAFMVLAALFWAALTVLVRMLSADYSTFQILFCRNVVALVVLAPVIARAGWGVMATRRLPLHGLRAVLAYVGMLGFFYGVAHIPIADVVALSFTQPLFIVVLAALILGEAVGLARWRATAIGLAGVLIILRPGFVEIGLATLAVIASSLLYAGSNTCIKALMSTDTPLHAVIYVNLLMLPLGLVPAVATWVTPGWTDAALMIGVGITGTLGVYFVSKAYHAADASAVVPYDFLRLPFAAAGAYVLFNEVADVWTWAGAAVIFVSSYALVRIERRSEAMPVGRNER
jgi:drug/metabolite transporter (DMT)-like permease